MSPTSGRYDLTTLQKQKMPIAVCIMCKYMELLARIGGRELS